ncbi:phasin family protein [Thermodesulfovibrionales bacterium]|nr:phasin family protein [Thermodesulfovibrionales bacterium]MCL0050050.1 phasin family protein [Thermodesulfovibrionales bacterium]MCL0061411.1 phasin family protein [Thermodesulfovibrionales bacterium]MCL0085774.1 phasin family protein [Thermodesulfovibrionales bacterium]
MTIFDVIRNTMLASLGAKEKVREFIDDLVKRGEVSESQGARLVKEWTDKADKSTSEFSKSISEVVTKTIEKTSIPTREDIETLNREIQYLSARVKKLEEKEEIL